MTRTALENTFICMQYKIDVLFSTEVATKTYLVFKRLFKQKIFSSFHIFYHWLYLRYVVDVERMY